MTVDGMPADAGSTGGAASRVSVVMPVHNNVRFVEAAVASILEQTCPPLELIVGDDGSTDATLAILDRLARGNPIMRVLRRDNRSGVANAMNWVVAAAKGDLVAIAHADDISFPDRLARQSAALCEHPDAALVGAPAIGIDAAGRAVHPANLWRLVRPSAFAPFAHSSVMFRQHAFQRAGGYRADADYWEDLDLFWRMSRLGALLALTRPVTCYRYSGDSIRSRDLAMTVERAIERMYGAADTLGEPVRDAARIGCADRIRPRVYIARSWGAVWSGKRPRTLKRLLRHGRLRFDRQTAVALAFVAAGELSPGALRTLLRWGAAVRNRLAKLKLGQRALTEWRPFPADPE